MNTNNSIYTWLIFNCPIFAVIVVGFVTGYLQPVFNDITFITHFIFAFTMASVLWTAYISFGIAKKSASIRSLRDKYRKNVVAAPKDQKDDPKDVLFLNLESALSFPKFAMKLVVGLGFLGTIVGVVIGFRYFPEGAFTDVNKMQDFVRMMLVGFSTELHSLLMGIVGRLWLSVIVFMQGKELRNLFIRIIENEK